MSSNNNTKQLTVLIVDDDEFMLDLYLHKAITENIYLHTATSGAAALMTLRDGLDPDVVVVDLGLLDMTGFELIKRLRSNGLNTDTPIIIFSNHDNPGLQTRAKKLGVSRYIIKAHNLPSEVMAQIHDVSATYNKNA